MQKDTAPLLEIKNLKVNFCTYEGVVEAVDIDDFKLFPSEVVGLVGESGCGKTTAALTVIKLIPIPPGKIESGSITFKEEDILKKDELAMRNIRGKQISVIFQNPTTSLNPVFTCGEQITRVIMLHQKLAEKEAEKKAIETFNLVRLPDPVRIFKSYPHQLSVGMRQRVSIAIALSCNPDLLIADEPTTALDVTIQAQILRLMNELRKEIGTAMLYITHDLAVAAQVCDRIAVMYAGNIVEVGNVKNIYKKPKHPYTLSLMKSIPSKEKKKEKMLPVIKGTVPTLINPPRGCRFHPRCDSCMEICKKEKPKAIEVEDQHWVSCFLYSRQGGGDDE
jgi:oligopeptide/dipeptide ABC transporter ATP-binding protein